MLNVISVDTLRAQVRAEGIAKEIVAIVNGNKHKFAYEMKNGQGSYIELGSEIISSADGATVLAEKIAFDIENGRVAVPRLFPAIYDVRNDPSAPQLNKVRHNMRGRVVFVKRLEGGEVVYGTLEAKDKDTIEIVTYSAGVAITREMKLYNDQFSLTEMNEATGEGANALLNHLHLSPIINFAYAAGNKQAAITTAATKDEQLRETIEAALVKANKLPTFTGTFSVLFTHDDNLFRVQRALAAATIGGTVYAPVTGITPVFYKGWTGVSEGKNVTYAGVDPTKAYLIRPQVGFKSIIKEDMVVEIGAGQVSRGITDDIVTHCSLGIWAAIADNVIEITLP